jgi:hypothetical protein
MSEVRKPPTSGGGAVTRRGSSNPPRGFRSDCGRAATPKGGICVYDPRLVIPGVRGLV